MRGFWCRGAGEQRSRGDEGLLVQRG